MQFYSAWRLRPPQFLILDGTKLDLCILKVFNCLQM